MKRIYTTLFGLIMAVSLMAQGWPANYGGVMLQGFYWDSYSDTQWTTLEKQADELASYFSLIWVPQGGRCIETYNVMGYTPYYYFDQNSSFGTEAQLRSMISTFKAKGLGTIADVVVNHRNTNGWFSFPAETYGGVTYQMLASDICANDDEGKTKTQATKEGVTLSTNNDEGEDWNGCRDLDHKSANVQTIIKAYLKYLKDDLGYTGFRYDMVKGFDASHVADYNDAAGVEYSVGENWSDNATVKKWIDGTSKKSAAFDFQFHYALTDAIKNSDWQYLRHAKHATLVSDASTAGKAYRQYAVTFVENHDIQTREGGNTSADPIADEYVTAANAYLLSMPGTPCVFLPHWQSYKQDIKGMIDIRKAVGITNQSDYTLYADATTYSAQMVTGTNGNLIIVVGDPSKFTAASTAAWTKIVSAPTYAYYLSNALGTAWIDKASGTYAGSVSPMLTAATRESGAKLVYTTDGTTPTASSQTIASGETLSITSDCTLTVGLLVGGTVKGIVSRTYTITEPEPEVTYPHDIKIYVNADNAGWGTLSKVNFWTWGGDGTHAPANSKWPGDAVTTTENVSGKSWFVKTYTINSSSDYVSFVFSTGTGSPQTVNKEKVKTTSFFEISASKDSQSHNLINDVTETTAIHAVTAIERTADDGWYTVSGLRLSGQPTQKGLYIHGGRKVVVK